MLAEPYKGNDDAFEMAAALLGRPWSELPIHELFLHREMVFALSPVAYRAYLPAYLNACLATEDPYDKYGADIRAYLLYGLKPGPNSSEVRVASTRARLALLDQEQREVVASVLRYLEVRWRIAEAGELLSEWDAASG
jgi:hypothetical protein